MASFAGFHLQRGFGGGDTRTSGPGGSQSVGADGGVPLLWRRDDRFKTFRFEFHTRRPLDRRAAGRSLLPSLLLQGTAKDPSRPALSRRMESLYGAAVYPSTFTRGASHVLRTAIDAVSGEFLPGEPDQIGDCVNFLVEQLTAPRLESGAFPAETFERERREALDALRALVDDKGAWSRLRALEFACEGEPIGIPEHGSVEDLEALDAGSCEAARRDFLEHGLSHAVAVGALPDDGDALAERLAGFFASLPHSDTEPVASADPITPRPTRRLVEKAEGAQQAKLVMVFRLPPVADGEDPDTAHAARRMADHLFGGGPQSRLFREVREKHSLAYYAQSGFDRHTGLLTVHVGCDPDKIEAVEHEVVQQLGAIADGAATEGDLVSSRAQLTSRLTRIDESLGSMAMFASEQWIHGDDRTPADLAAAYQDTAPEAVAAAAASAWLDAVYALRP
jgi:predicted Zn-dependent peptidase